MANVQPLLSPRKDVSGDFHVVYSQDSASVSVMLGVAVLERIPCSRDQLQYKMLVGRLVNAGWPLDKLRCAFGHDPRTMKAWGAALLSEDPDFIVRVFSGRGQHGKVSTPAARYIRRRYRELRSLNERRYREIIRDEVADLFDEELSRETLRCQFREADLEDEPGEQTPSETDSESESTATGCHQEESTAEPGADSVPGDDNRSPEPETVQPMQSSAPARKTLFHHAGMILFAAVLELFCRGRPYARGWQSQWIGQILQGAVNIEQSRTINVEDLAYFTGPVNGGVDAQRRTLRRQADVEHVMDIYQANARVLPDGPGKDRVFYYDPHSKEYTGGHDVLKDWCGQQRGVKKVLHMDMLHTRSGRPCFVQHYSPYYDLRERFFISMELFNRLFPEDQRSGRLFVIDRAIYGLEQFQRFKAAGDDLLTWEKDYKGDGWHGKRADVVFSRYRSRNRASDLRRYTFKCREEPWHRDHDVRRILVQATNPQGRTIRVSILCTDQQIDLREAVWLMFNRWLQENNFKYGDKNFGFNQMTSYATRPIAEEADSFRDQPVDSPEYRELKNRLQRTESALAGELLKRERYEEQLNAENQELADLEQKKRELKKRLSSVIEKLRQSADQTAGDAMRESEKLQEQHKKMRKNLSQVKRKKRTTHNRIAQVEDRINTLKHEALQLSKSLEQAVRKQSRLQLLIDRRYRILDTRCKAMFDALRISSFNMFASLLDIFRPLYDNRRNDHVMLRQLTRADGIIQRMNGTIYIQLRLKGRFEQRQWSIFNSFLAEMTDRINERLAPESEKVRITLLASRPQW